MARTMRCAMVGSGTRKARAISSVVRPPNGEAQGKRPRALPAERTGWQAVKIGLEEQIVADIVIVGRGVEVRYRHFAFTNRGNCDFLVLAAEEFVAAKKVESAMLCGGHQPPAGIARNALSRPLLQRGQKSVLREVLGVDRGHGRCVLRLAIRLGRFRDSRWRISIPRCAPAVAVHCRPSHHNDLHAEKNSTSTGAIASGFNMCV